MRPDDLTPSDRELAQLTLIRVHLARIARQKWTGSRVDRAQSAREPDDASATKLVPLPSKAR